MDSQASDETVWWIQSSGSLAMFSGTCSTVPSSTLAEYYIAEQHSPYFSANRQSTELSVVVRPAL
jgi:hypothetical protein